MIDIKSVASYICQQYKRQYNQIIDERKLHRLLYLAQRESLIQLGKPMFKEEFQAWKNGPVMVEIRKPFQENKLTLINPDRECREYRCVFDKVFSQYAKKDSWSLSSLTNGEYSWKKARQGISDEVNGNNKLLTSDIGIDAERIKHRRVLFS